MLAIYVFGLVMAYLLGRIMQLNEDERIITGLLRELTLPGLNKDGTRGKVP